MQPPTKEINMKNIATAAIIALSLIATVPAHAGSDIYAEYVKNYDGDTVTFNLPDLADIDLDETYAIFWKKARIRVAGLDTPEVRTRCKSEKVLGKQAKALVKEILSDAEHITLRNVKRGKYFRIVADIIINPGEPTETNLKDILFDSGLAVPYDGGKKTKNWCY